MSFFCSISIAASHQEIYLSFGANALAIAGHHYGNGSP
jgi:hypothetical protein